MHLKRSYKVAQVLNSTQLWYVVVCTEPGFILRLVARTDSAKNLERNRDKAMAKSKENMDGMK